MNVLYEEEGAFKVGSILADNDTSLQVEAPHGKRSKVKAGAVLLRFNDPSAAVLLEQAQAMADETEADFLWEVGGTGEFGFNDLAEDYFGHKPSPVEAAAILMRLHASPMHFYKKGKGRYKPAPAEALQAAKASVERKRQQALQQAAYVEELSRFRLPQAFGEHVNELLYRPNKNSIEFKALEEACLATGLSAPRLLEKCGALESPHDYHFNAFLFEHFPRGIDFGHYGEFFVPTDLPVSNATAFSIDDAATTEIDDAFSVSKLPNGNWRVGIHIAAPALGILPESPLDQIALDRLSTVYMPGNKITMLPDPVVDSFTLSAGRTCPAVSMYLEVDPATHGIVASESRIELVNVAANLRHDTLEPVFNDLAVAQNQFDFEFGQELGFLWHLADRLEIGRGKQDPNRAPQVDYSFVIDGGRVSIAQRTRGNPIDKVVSEMMIHVNSRWGALLAEKGYPAIYRSQNNGKVRMSTAPAPHQGLGVQHYTWASSPLRRAVDLINQRQLVALLKGEEAPYPKNSEKLFAAMRDFDIAYDVYNNFQRSMERYWCLRYIEQEHLEQMTGAVIKENLVRFDNMPFVSRVHGMPELAPGSRVEVNMEQPDLLTLEVNCTYRGPANE
jgi:exoribonuclease-2